MSPKRLTAASFRLPKSFLLCAFGGFGVVSARYATRQHLSQSRHLHVSSQKKHGQPDEPAVTVAVAPDSGEPSETLREMIKKADEIQDSADDEMQPVPVPEKVIARSKELQEAADKEQERAEEMAQKEAENAAAAGRAIANSQGEKKLQALREKAEAIHRQSIAYVDASAAAQVRRKVALVQQAAAKQEANTAMVELQSAEEDDKKAGDFVNGLVKEKDDVQKKLEELESQLTDAYAAKHNLEATRRSVEEKLAEVTALKANESKKVDAADAEASKVMELAVQRLLTSEPKELSTDEDELDVSDDAGDDADNDDEDSKEDSKEESSWRTTRIR